MNMHRGYLSSFLSSFLCFWIIENFAICQILVPLKAALADCSSGVETFEKVTGIELPPSERIPLFSSTTGAITADCYNRCRSSSSCSAFWIDYSSSSCFRLGNPKFTDSDNSVEVDFSKASSYFERLCLQGDICSKAWVTERIPGHELAGHDDVIIRSVSTRKRCSELCLTDKRLPCRSADFWALRKECRLSREDRRTQPGSFVKSSREVEYIENTCIEPVSSSTKERHCEWEVMHGFDFPIGDFSTKAESLEDCQKSCEAYAAFTCRSVTFDRVTGICFLSGADMSTTSPKLLKSHENKVYAQRVPCIDMSLECNGDSMTAKLKTHSPFYGKMYSSALSTDCEVFGKGSVQTILQYPLSSCGVYKDNDGSFIGNLVVQQHPLIQKRGDAAFRLICTFPATNRTLTQTLGFEKESESRLDVTEVESVTVDIFLFFDYNWSGDSDIPNLWTIPLMVLYELPLHSGQMEAGSNPAPILGIATSVINSTAKAPSIVFRITDKSGNDVSGVTLGDELYIKIEVEADSAYGIFARDLVAKSGTNEEQLVLLDSRGCPEDPAIFPHLKKAHDGSKSLKGRFEAFKFTNDAVVRFQVYLQFCRNECPPIKCDGELSHGRKRRGNDNSDVEFVELQKEIIVTGPHDRKSKAQIGKHSESIHHRDNGMVICGPKNLLIAIIIGFCLLQIVIVFFCAVCLCHRSKDKLMGDPTFRSSELYYARPNLFNTMQSLRSRRD